MGFLEKIFSPKNNNKKEFSSNITLGGDYSFSLGNGQNNDYVGWVFSCVRAISEDVAQIEPILYRYDGKGEKTIVADHPAIDLFWNPNIYFSKFELIERMQANLELEGNEFWYIDIGKNGEPVAIYPLRPNCVTPVFEGSILTKYKYFLNGKNFEISSEFILHFKNYNPKNDFKGMSTLSAVKVTANTDQFAQIYNESFFRNSARPSSVLKYPGVLTRDMKDQFMRSWENSYQGAGKAFRTVLLEGGLTLEPPQVNHQDMQYLEGRKWNRDEILGIFRVPKTVLGIVEDVNFASAKASNYIFALRNIKPKMQKIIDKLNNSYLPLFGEVGLEFGFKNPVPEDVEEQTKLFQVGLTNGFLSHNDVRRVLGLSEIQNGDQYYFPFNLQPFSSGVEKKSTPGINTKELLNKSIEDIATILQKENQVKEKTSDEFEKIGQQKWDIQQKDLEKWELIYLQTTEKLFADQLKRITMELKKQLGKSFEEKISKKQQMPDVFDEEEELQTTIDLFKPLFGVLTEEQGKEALIALGLNPADFTIENPKIAQIIAENLQSFAGGITETTATEIRAQVIAGVEQGEGAVKIGRRLSDSFGFSKSRAEMIARTEVNRGANISEREAWKMSGVVKEKTWWTAEDERVEPNCAGLHGKTFPLDYVYDFGSTEPPYHPRCRCVLLPVV